MASIVLSTAGAVVGSAIPVVGPLVGGAVGQALGGLIGGAIDDAIFGVPTVSRAGSRLTDLSVQVSTYGKMVPLVYGTVRIAGNVIWSRPIKETAVTSTSSSSGGKGGSGRVESKTTTYQYSASLAVSLCEGPIDSILRVWADADQLDLSRGTYRVYNGTEDQLPDPFIESFEGIGSTPAYRGLAYVVIEDFPLADYGNRIPNFTFEVKRTVRSADYNGLSTEELVDGMVMIPGAGEFVYDTDIQYQMAGELVGSDWAQNGEKRALNMHNYTGKANALLSLDQLQETCPNVGWVAVVVCWFGDSLDVGTCVIKPGVEYQTGATTVPDVWQVGSFTRATARQITLEDGNPRYGGTPDDDSLLRYLTEVKDRGYDILFLPLFFMDTDDKPWRGRVTGTPSNVNSFFTKTDGYNAFVTHYANLVKDHVDAFAIGSEMIGLTKVTDTPGNYPAVNQLVSLAATVKGIVGSGVKVTYAADWSEYHHAENGWYNLDPLWASPNIDIVGIDAYFPLTNAPQGDLGYNIQNVIDGWTEGEGYDWYYSDTGRTIQTSLQPKYAWKNIAWWWNNTHINPNSVATAWTPQMKKIWFTEFGFPSVDGATNQPNVFYDPTSSESFFPYHSRGQVDFRAQRTGITGTLAKWQGSNMIERTFLWTWDARPYPYFPDLREVWADGGVWITGHWVTGKLGLSSLAAIVRRLCLKAGLTDSNIDVSRLGAQVEGYVVTRQTTIRSLIEELMSAYFFDSVESSGTLKFIPRGQSSILTKDKATLIREESEETLAIARRQELELPRDVNVIYLNRLNQYQAGTQTATREYADTQDSDTLSLSIVMTDQEAKAIADRSLYLRWMERTHYQFYLGMEQAHLEPADVMSITENDILHTLRITRTLADRGRIRVNAVAEDIAIYETNNPVSANPGLITATDPLSATQLVLLDLPAFPSDDATESFLRYGVAGESRGWRGAVVYRSDDAGSNYAVMDALDVPAVIGTATTALGEFTGGNCFDTVNTLTVRLLGSAELESMTELAVLNGANAALVGEEIIQFKTASEIEPGKYQLSGLLRGRLGTEWAISAHAAGERFVLLDGKLEKEKMPLSALALSKLYKPVTIGGTPSLAYTYAGKALKPYAPVHISGTRDGSGNLTISWVRRTRIGGEWRDGVEIPLAETAEKYEVEILSGSTALRTLASNSPTALYSTVNQVADFGSNQSAVTIKIYQISEAVGRGYAASAIV